MTVVTLASGDSFQGVAGTATAVTYTLMGGEFGSANTYKKLAQGQLPSSAGSLYSPSGAAGIVKIVLLANATGSDVTGIKFFVGGTAGLNQVTGTVTIPANGSARIDESGLKVYDATGLLITTSQLNFSATAPVTILPDAAGSPGVSVNPARSDHSHPIVADVVVALGAAAAEGVSTSFARADHVHPFFRLDQATAPSGDVAMAGHRITGAADGTAAQDLTTLNQVTNLVAGLLDYRGSFNASTNLFPAAGGSGVAGAVLKGDFWAASAQGTLGSTVVRIGDWITALVDTPAQTAANWDIIEHDLGYAPEDVANKSTDGTFGANSTTLYPSQSAAKSYVDSKTWVSTQITDFVEAAQDAAFGAVADTTDIDFTYNDPSNALSAIVIANAITNAKLAQMGAHTYKGNNTGSTANVSDITAAQLAVDLPLATGSAQGMLSPTNFSQINNFFGVSIFNVLDYGITPANSASTNVTNMNTLLQTTAPDNAVIYFPPGLYQFNASLTALTKDFMFKGDARGNAQIALTANLSGSFITCLNTGFYTSFVGLSFVNFVTQTAGAVISFQNNANPLVQDCFYTGGATSTLNNILDFTGSSAGTGAVIRNLYANGWSGIGINIASPLDTIYMSDLEMIGTVGAQVASVGIQCTSGGALELVDSQIIRCTTLLNLAAATGQTVSAVFGTNCFFDQGVVNALRVTGAGTGTVARCHFVASWFTSGASGTSPNCIQIDSSGTGIHAGIEFQDCWIINATPGSTGTLTGIMATAVQDITINNSQFAGWTTDVNLTPASAGTCRPLIEGNTMDTAGLITGSATNIILNAGSFTYGSINIQNNTLGGTATKIVDNSTQAVSAQKLINGNLGLPLGAVKSAAQQALTTVDTVLAQIPIPVGSLRIGTTFRISGYINRAAATLSVLNIRARFGTAGTNADAQVILIAPSSPATANTAGYFEMLITVRAIGNGTTTLAANGRAQGQVNNATSAVAFTYSFLAGLAQTLATGNSTVANFLTLTLANGTSSTTDVYDVAIEVLQQ